MDLVANEIACSLSKFGRNCRSFVAVGLSDGPGQLPLRYVSDRMRPGSLGSLSCIQTLAKLK